MQFIKNNKKLITSIITISFPAIAEMSLNTLVGIADTLMISYLIGKEGLTASGYANQIIQSIILIFSSFNIGATAIISRSYGEKNYKRINEVLGQNLLLNIIIGTIVMAVSILFQQNIMGIFDTSQEVLEMGLSYFRIVSYSQIFTFISFAAASSLRGVTDTRTPLIITGIANMLNIIGNYVLMTGFWIFPNLGIAGAAVSTSLSRFIGAIIYIVILFKGKNGLKLHIKDLKITKKVILPLWNLSYTAGIEQLLMQLSFIVASVFVAFLDTTAEATYRILLTIEQLSLMPAIGFSIAAAALVGKSLGEQDQQKALHTGYISCGCGILWGIIIGSTFIAFPNLIMKLFTNDTEIILSSKTAMIVSGLDQPFLAFIVIISGALRGAGDTRTVMLLSTLRLWTMFVPLVYILIVYMNMGVESVWIAEMISYTIFIVITLKRFQSKKWAQINI